MKPNFVIDIDGTLCKTVTDGDYFNAEPRPSVIATLNKLYQDGSHITLFTARGMRTYNGDIAKINEHVRPLLEMWLDRHQVKYHTLIMGKPWAPDVYYVDDRAMLPEDFVELFLI